jgi:ubiquinone/menaquinone biosynthesis C-methylase UbiE
MHTNGDTERRLESERQFHNARFAEETRDPVAGFYRTIDDCIRDYRAIVTKLSKGKEVLEYGCAKGDNALGMAHQCALIYGIDISDVAIESARTEARARGISNAKFDVMNAEQLEFKDATFDLIFGSGIIHHLDVARAYSELQRVLKPGGTAVFVEPLGHNPIINAFRNRTPELRTPDEHPLLRADFILAHKYFARVSVKLYGLATLAAIPVIRTPLAGILLSVGKIADKVLLKLPGVKWWAWYSLLVFQKT